MFTTGLRGDSIISEAASFWHDSILFWEMTMQLLVKLRDLDRIDMVKVYHAQANSNYTKVPADSRADSRVVSH